MPTKIPYATETLELTSGCTPVSEGCANCWAKRLAEGRLKRFYRDGFHRITLHGDLLNQPLRWRKPRRVLVCSRSDLFHPHVPWSFRYRALATMEECPLHIFLLLTKRADEMADQLRVMYPPGYELPPHIWPGMTAENQKRANERLPLLCQIPAKVRWPSLEPLLGPVDLTPWLDVLGWVVVGGESGPGYRLMEIAWLEKVVADCRAAGVPVWVKQDSNLRPGLQGRISSELWIQEWPQNEQLYSPA